MFEFIILYEYNSSVLASDAWPVDIFIYIKYFEVLCKIKQILIICKKDISNELNINIYFNKLNLKKKM